MIVPLELPTRSNPARYTQGGTARLVNCFMEQIGKEGKTQTAIYAVDGLQGFAATPDANGPIRAMLPVGTYLYYVAGTSLYRVTESGAVSHLGAMSISATAPVYMARNRRATPDVGIVCDGLTPPREPATAPSRELASLRRQSLPASTARDFSRSS